MINIIKYLLLVFYLGLQFLAFSQDKVVIETTTLNSPEIEYGPMYFKNGLVFSGVNVNNEVLTYLDSKTGKQMTDLYFVPIKNNIFGKRELFSSKLKTSFHDGAITFSKDGKIAYFTRSQVVDRKLKSSLKKEIKLGVFRTVFDGKEWSEIQKCDFNTLEYNYGHPSLSADGKKLYLISDQEGGFGGKDIYVTEIIDGVCGPLVNLGETINSPSNEMFPFIDSKGNLFFSSDRDGGRGGLDLYYSNFLNNQWINPVALDTSFNTMYDDFSLIFDSVGTEGYFSSTRNGSDDIFKVKILYPEFGDCEEMKEEQLCFEFYEEATLNVDSVAMIYEWDFGDGVTEKNTEVYHCYKEPGFYIVELNIMDPVIDKYFVNMATYELELEEVLQPKIICNDSIPYGEKYFVKVEQGKWKEFKIENFYIDYGDSTVTKNDRSPHIYSSTGIKELKVLISGKDSTSGELLTHCFYKIIKVNESENSFIAAKEKLKILDFIGFTADKMDVLDDSYYSLEILKSIESIKGDSALLNEYTLVVREMYNDSTKEYSYLFGKTSNPLDLIKEFRRAQELGFNEVIVKSIVNDTFNIALADISELKIDEEVVINIVLNDIYFMFGSSEFEENSKKEMDKLVKFLNKSKNVKIEIGAYTDAARNVEKAQEIFKKRGLNYTKDAHDKMSSSYNLRLSQQRALSVVNYLVKKRIAKNRLVGKGYGEKKPAATNKTEEGRAKNRRVAFKILAQ